MKATLTELKELKDAGLLTEECVHQQSSGSVGTQTRLGIALVGELKGCHPASRVDYSHDDEKGQLLSFLEDLLKSLAEC